MVPSAGVTGDQPLSAEVGYPAGLAGRRRLFSFGADLAVVPGIRSSSRVGAAVLSLRGLVGQGPALQHGRIPVGTPRRTAVDLCLAGNGRNLAEPSRLFQDRCR